jgi:tetratricopeptide (TPR) repeat protein
MATPRELLENTVASARTQPEYGSITSEKLLAASEDVLHEALRDHGHIDKKALVAVVWLHILRVEALRQRDIESWIDLGIALILSVGLLRLNDEIAITLPEKLLTTVTEVGSDTATKDARSLIFGAAPMEPSQVQVAKLALLASAMLAESARARRESYAFLANFNHEQFTRSNNMEELQECIANLRIATAEARLDTSDCGPRALDLDNLGTMLYLLFSLTEDLDYLKESAFYHERALSVSQVGDDLRAHILDNLGASLFLIAKATGDPVMLRKSLETYRMALAVTGENLPEQGAVMGKLWSAMRLVPAVCGVGADLSATIEEGRNLLAAADSGNPHYSRYLEIMAHLNICRYRLDGEVAADCLDEAITYIRLARDMSSGTDMAEMTIDLGASLMDRFCNTGVLADLEEAMALLGGCPNPDDARFEAIRLRNLRSASSLMEQATANVSDTFVTNENELDQAAAAAGRLFSYFLSYSLVSYLDRAIEIAEDAARLDGGRDHRDINLVLVNLWTERSQVTGQAAHLDYTLKLAEDLYKKTPGDAEVATELGNIYRLRFELRGRLDDINKAVSTLHDALDLSMTSGLCRHVRNRLGLALLRRFEHTNDMSDLRHAIKVLRDAANENSGQDRDQDYELIGSALDNLGGACFHMHSRTGSPEILTECIDSLNRSVDLGTGNEINYAVRLDNLAIALKRRYYLNREISDLRAAREAAEKAVGLTPQGRVDRFRKLRTLSLILFEQYNMSHDLSDLQSALIKGKASVKACPLHHSARAETLVLFAENLFKICREPGLEDHLQLALDSAAEAKGSESSFLDDRCRAAVLWAELVSLDDLSAAVEGAGEAFRLFSAIDWHGMRMADRLSRLSRWSGFATTAASWAIDIGDLTSAVRLLEEGRALLWAQFRDVRSELPENVPEIGSLLEDLDAVQARLRTLAMSAAMDSVQRGDQIITLNARRRRILEEIRQLPGLSEFLSPPSLPFLAGAARKGPVVILNVAHRRCDAIVLREKEGQANIECVSLPNLSASLISEMAYSFYQALDDARSARNELLHHRTLRRSAPRSTKIVFATALDQLERVLAWGWENITEPVLNSLGYAIQPCDVEDWPRLWWCPTGALAFLPLHAMGYHDGSGRAVIDRVISSETMTIDALARSYLDPRLSTSALPPDLLAVSVAKPAGANLSLASAAAELDGIENLAIVGVTRLENASATHDRILSLIPSYSWFHFAGHGSNSLLGPQDAALWACDRPITLVDLTETLHRRAELAYLSTCYGVMPNLEHLDEALHLAGAFNTMGFQHVIACKYPLVDEIACELTCTFFRQLPQRHDPGLALHHAVRSLRKRLAAARCMDDLVHPYEWIGHAHIGPALPVSLS